MHHKSKFKEKVKKDYTCFAKPLIRLAHLQIHIKLTMYQ